MKRKAEETVSVSVVDIRNESSSEPMVIVQVVKDQQVVKITKSSKPKIPYNETLIDWRTINFVIGCCAKMVELSVKCVKLRLEIRKVRMIGIIQ